MDVDTRLLRYFEAVAEEGNLTRAAQRLFVSQPALTKQIKQLETLLGVQLFVRSRTGMALTAPGRSLAENVSAVLESWDKARRETRRTAARVLRVGFIASAANEATQRIIAAYCARRPDWRVEMRQTSWAKPDAGLSQGDVDVALLRLPFPGQEALRVEVILTEPRLIAMRSNHPLAGREEIAFAELLEEPFVAAPAETGPWRDYWLAADVRGGRAVRVGAVTDQPDEWLSAIANGDGVALAPESASRYYARPGVVYRRVTGVSPTQVAVAWSPTDDENPAVRDFVDCCVAASAEG